MAKRKEKPEVVKMTREDIMASLQVFPTETKLKAWIMQIDTKFYHIAEFGAVYRVPSQTAIWEANKKGKRQTEKPFLSINGQDHKKLIGMFLDSIEAAEAKAISDAEEAKMEAEINAEIDAEIKLVEENHNDSPENDYKNDIESSDIEKSNVESSDVV